MINANTSCLQASSDLSILDFDIPFAIGFVVAGGTELLAMIGIMVSVTWQILIVAVLAMVASKYTQVCPLSLCFVSPSL